MDETAKYILDKPNSSDELSANSVRENTLVRIRRQLKRDKIKVQDAKESLKGKPVRKKT